MSRSGFAQADRGNVADGCFRGGNVELRPYGFIVFIGINFNIQDDRMENSSAPQETPRRRARGGGGAARRAERTAPKFEAAKFIERNIPNFEILNAEALEIIEYNAETVLEEIGVNFVDNPEALQRWRDVGADVVGERVRIPRGAARRASASPCWTRFERTGRHSSWRSWTSARLRGTTRWRCTAP